MLIGINRDWLAQGEDPIDFYLEIGSSFDVSAGPDGRLAHQGADELMTVLCEGAPVLDEIKD